MNLSTNHTNSSFIPLAADCRVWKEEYYQENYVSTLAAIILNMVTCPLTVFVNLLVIIAVKTKRRLQTSYNIVLACLAATDLVVGAIVQPSFIVGETFLITGATLMEYCAHYNRSIFLFLAPCLASLHLLALLSIERYLAMKYSLRYQEIKNNQVPPYHCCYQLLGCRSDSINIRYHSHTVLPSSGYSSLSRLFKSCSDYLLPHFCLFRHPSSHAPNQN